MSRPRVRIVAGLLWFGAIWFAWELAWSMLDVPRIVGPILAATAGLVVAFDPLRLIWTTRLAVAQPDAAVVPSMLQPLPGGRMLPPETAISGEPAATDQPGKTAETTG